MSRHSGVCLISIPISQGLIESSSEDTICVPNLRTAAITRFTDGVNVVTGDGNVVSARTEKHTFPPPSTVDAVAELAALREITEELKIPDRAKCRRALEDADEETAKPNPDKEELAGAIERVVKYAKAADDFGEHAAKMLPRILALGSWLGTHGRTLLSMFGVQV